MTVTQLTTTAIEVVAIVSRSSERKLDSWHASSVLLLDIERIPVSMAYPRQQDVPWSPMVYLSTAGVFYIFR